MAVYENNAILKEAGTDSSCIPSTCLSFYEQSLYVAESTEITFNALFESIGVNELSVYESSGEMVVYEGGKLESFKKAVIDAIKSVWEKIKGLYNNILESFEKKRKELLNNALKKVADKNVIEFVPEKDFGKIHKFDLSISDKFIDGAKEMQSKISAALEKSNAETVKEVKNDLEEQIVSVISGVDAKKLNDAKKELRSKMIGEEINVGKKWVQDNYNDLVDIVMKGSTKKDIQKSYQDEKKNIDRTISEVKKLKDENMDVANAQISLLKSVISTLSSCCSIKIDVCKRRYNEYSMILLKLTKLSYSKKVNNESAEMFKSSTYQKDLIESVFEW